MPSQPILVAGAGPTGLVLALSLARHGAPVRIIDRASGPGETSRAMVVHARNLEFYQQFGFAQEVIDRGIKVEAVRIHESGKQVAKVAFGDIGDGLSPFPFLLCYPQDDHERLLVDKLRAAGVEVERDTTLVSFTDEADGVHAVLRGKDGAEERVCTPYLCGCDGGHSAVRRGVQLEFPGGSYEQLFYVADAETADTDEDLNISLDEHGFGLKLPVRSSGMHRLIGVVPEALTGRKDLRFEDFRPRVEGLLGIEVRRVNWFSTYHVHHRVAAHFRSGRCFLAGDAGHVHSPVGGQGMNTGIGDAINLAWKLAAVVQGRADASILDTYEPERIPFARQLVATTDRGFELAVGQSRTDEIIRTWILPHLAPLLTGFSAVRRFMFRAVSQTRIRYHDSVLSEGKAGHVEGGDRLPWVRSCDNFAPLRSLAWQVHVYGEADPALQTEADRLGMALHRFDWSDDADAAGLTRGAAYVVRPDAYVGLAMAKPDGAALRAYAARIGLRAAT